MEMEVITMKLKGKVIFGKHSDMLQRELDEFLAKTEMSSIKNLEVKMITDRESVPIMLIVILYEAI